MTTSNETAQSLLIRAMQAKTVEMCEIIANTAKQFDSSIDIREVTNQWMEQKHNNYMDELRRL